MRHLINAMTCGLTKYQWSLVGKKVPKKFACNFKTAESRETCQFKTASRKTNARSSQPPKPPTRLRRPRNNGDCRPVRASKVDEQLLFNKGFSLNCSDLDVLSEPCCINSRIIDFYFSLLSEASQHTRAGHVLLVPTSVSSSIVNFEDFEKLYEIVGKYGLREKEVSIFVVHDWDDASDNQTCRHWSLLVYVQKQNQFLHYDSCEETNEPHSRKLCDVLKPFLGYPELLECRTPQQTHFEDSGMFVMAITREICAWCDSGLDQENDQLWFSNLEKMNRAAANDMKRELLALINVLMDEDMDSMLRVGVDFDEDTFNFEFRVDNGVDEDTFDSELRADYGVDEDKLDSELKADYAVNKGAFESELKADIGVDENAYDSDQLEKFLA